MTAGIAAVAIAETKPAATPMEAPVDPAYMWDLSDFYPSAEAWTAEHDRVKAVTDTLDKYKGTLGKSAKDMLAALDAISDVQRADARLAAYAGLKADEDVRIAANQERQQLAASLADAARRKDVLGHAGNPRDRRRQGARVREGQAGTGAPLRLLSSTMSCAVRRTR